MLKEAFFAVAASREPKMDRVRPAMLIAALVVDVGRRLPRRCGSAVPASTRLSARSMRTVVSLDGVSVENGRYRYRLVCFWWHL